MKPYNLLVKNGTIVTPDGSYSGSVAVSDGKVAAILEPKVSCEAQW